MADVLAQYPTSLDSAPAVLIRAIRYTEVNPHAVRAAWHLAGFALSQAYPDPDVIQAAGGVGKLLDGVVVLSPMDLADVLECHGDQKLREAKGFPAIDWKVVLKTLLQLIELWLATKS